MEPASYSAVETLRDGRPVEIRALKPEDRADLLAAVDRTSQQSLYRGFFLRDAASASGRRNMWRWWRTVHEGGRAAIVGGGRYSVVEPEKAEVAFAVVDEYHRQGLVRP